MILLWSKGFNTSSTMNMSPQVLATAITCLPLPRPSFAPSMIPGRSSSFIQTDRHKQRKRPEYTLNSITYPMTVTGERTVVVVLTTLECLACSELCQGPTCIFAPLYLMTPGTVVSVVNSYAATSEYTPARLVISVDLPTDGKPGAVITREGRRSELHNELPHWQPI